MMTQPAENAGAATAAHVEIAAGAAAPAAVLLPEPAETGFLQAAANRHAELARLLARGAQAHGSGAAGALDADYVHDLRVATRRLEEAAGIIAVLMDKLVARVVAKSLKGLRKSAGELRDLDVAGAHLTGAPLAAAGKWRMPAALRALARELAEEMRQRRADLERKLRAQAASGSVAGAMVLLARAIEEHAAAQKSPAAEKAPAAEKTLARELQKKVERRHKQLRKAFGKAALKQTAESLHAARIAAKKLRYVLELAEASGAGRHKKRLAFLKGIQKLLGDHHDVHVVEAMLGERVSTKTRGAPAAPAKGLAAQWRKWQRAKEREQAGRAAEFFARSYTWMNARV